MLQDSSMTMTFAEMNQKKINQVKQLSKKQVVKLMDEFDWNPKYGPYSGLSREQRYQRAQNLGLNPPIEIFPYLNEFPHPYAKFPQL